MLEYVDGETLKDASAARSPDIAESIAYAIEIARALGAAHERRIVHRDVKPQNVLIDAEGGAKITDFGIARSLTEEGLTMAGRVLGTTDYVSPEQALGHDVTGQSDLYSLGVVLYEMLTGEVPFRGDSQIAVAMRHVREEMPDVQDLRPERVRRARRGASTAPCPKDLRAPLPRRRAMIADLEEALAIEAARTGQATGEATACCARCRAARSAVPLRVRHPVRWAVSRRLLVAVAAIALVLAASGTHGGTGVPPGAGAAGLRAVSLGQTAAHGYNPFGTGPEDRARIETSIDGDPNTFVEHRAATSRAR